MMKRICFRVAAMAAILVTCPLLANAEILYQIGGDCPNGSASEYWWHNVIKDDATGKVYTVTRTCDGKDHILPLGKADGTRITWDDVTTTLDQPAGYASLVQNQNYDTAGDRSGVYMMDDANPPNIFYAYNCSNQQEQNYYDSLYAVNGSGGSRPEISGGGAGLMYERMRLAYEDDLASNNVETMLVTSYMQAKFPQSNQLLSEDEDIAVVLQLVANRSNVLVKRTPSNENGYALVIAPITSLLTGKVTVINSAGTIVWSGDLVEQTAIDMSNQPSGTYFVQGMGKPIMIGVIK